MMIVRTVLPQQLHFMRRQFTRCCGNITSYGKPWTLFWAILCQYWNCRMKDEIRKNLELSGRGVIELLSRNLRGRIQVSHLKYNCPRPDSKQTPLEYEPRACSLYKLLQCEQWNGINSVFFYNSIINKYIMNS
jgi:hypothetical protein